MLKGHCYYSPNGLKAIFVRDERWLDWRLADVSRSVCGAIVHFSNLMKLKTFT